MNPVVTVVELSKMLKVDPDYIRVLGRREKDPLPIRILPGKQLGQFVVVEELSEWMRENAPLIADAPGRRRR